MTPAERRCVAPSPVARGRPRRERGRASDARPPPPGVPVADEDTAPTNRARPRSSLRGPRAVVSVYRGGCAEPRKSWGCRFAQILEARAAFGDATRRRRTVRGAPVLVVSPHPPHPRRHLDMRATSSARWGNSAAPISRIRCISRRDGLPIASLDEVQARGTREVVVVRELEELGFLQPDRLHGTIDEATTGRSPQDVQTGLIPRPSGARAPPRRTPSARAAITISSCSDGRWRTSSDTAIMCSSLRCSTRASGLTHPVAVPRHTRFRLTQRPYSTSPGSCASSGQKAENSVRSARSHSALTGLHRTSRSAFESGELPAGSSGETMRRRTMTEHDDIAPAERACRAFRDLAVILDELPGGGPPGGDRHGRRASLILTYGWPGPWSNQGSRVSSRRPRLASRSSDGGGGSVDPLGRLGGHQTA